MCLSVIYLLIFIAKIIIFLQIITIQFDFLLFIYIFINQQCLEKCFFFLLSLFSQLRLFCLFPTLKQLSKQNLYQELPKFHQLWIQFLKILVHFKAVNLLLQTWLFGIIQELILQQLLLLLFDLCHFNYKLIQLYLLGYLQLPNL
ncbi:hypothetical protein PPERSA_05864 [Pseudocohnilembus persalinus]|uniref:Transmembrane protein n=1 Tax=Pseudocohnilembus persalinus TaxID=266149 RepID=A0A0V0R3X4_PSEPJ|nr:hypothetical protein PPERSA_05864 [Pseudocohnilembus persalinus]|eukprot:KRX09195.1 hypothetical protein PPERSA_05864 [Pseudocohnilembus persalinus]